MAYDAVGNILNKNQYHKRRANDDYEWVEQHKTTHNFDYLYEGTQPNTATHIGEHSYAYDADGSMILREHDQNNQKRQIVYDEENRMLALADNGKASHYIYDAAGERIIKSHGDGQVVFVNGKPTGGSGTVGNFSVYASPYLVVQNLKYTKHFYIGSQRITSKLGESGSDIQDTTFAGAWSILADYDKLKGNMKDLIIAAFYELGLEGEVLPAGKSGKIPFGQIKKYLNNNNINNDPPAPNDQYERNQYYFHPDHLGSTSYLTDASGEVYQHLEYLPFGETLIEEHYNSDRNPYLYNGKELDEETELYFYGERYYDAKISRFYSVDPKTEDLQTQSPYLYAGNNPILYVDVNGEYGLPSHIILKYPKFASYIINNVEADITGSNTIVNAMIKYSDNGFTRTSIEEAVRFGSGPTINISEGYAMGEYYSNQAGEDIIEINMQLIEAFEYAKNDEEAEAALLLVFATLTHETVHYGDWLEDGRTQKFSEPGEAFVENVFTQNEETTIYVLDYNQEGSSINKEKTYENAQSIIKRERKKGGDIIPTLPKNEVRYFKWTIPLLEEK